MAINICIGLCAIICINLMLVILLEKGRFFLHAWVHPTALD